MSKRELKKYIHTLNKEQLEEQIVDLYTRFKDVKVFYDFAFNPQEDKLVEECKIKISNEYFPTGRRRAKMRRSTAQKFIKHFTNLGMDVGLIADIMLYNIEIAQTYTAGKVPRKDPFYKSMHSSFEKAVQYINQNGLMSDFQDRLERISDEAEMQRWINYRAFERVLIDAIN